MNPLSLAWYLPRWGWDHARDFLGIAPASHFPARYMSQHALAFSCDHHGGAAYVFWGIEGRPWMLDMSTYQNIRAGDSVWIRVEDVARFNREILPNVREPFVLVTAESDYCVPADFSSACQELLSSGRVGTWFATNLDASADRPRMRPLPLGMNYRKKHDLHWVQTERGKKLLKRERFSVRRQEEAWEQFARAAPPIEARLPLAFADFWLNNSSQSRRYGESREDIRTQLANNPAVVFPPHLLDQRELAEAYTRHALVISPHGRGLDCYRTWEALFFGCIVVVKSSALDPLYAELPVVIVNEWTEITTDNVRGWMQKFGSQFDRKPLHNALSLTYWTAQIEQAQAQLRAYASASTASDRQSV